jgi:hypothetical protein
MPRRASSEYNLVVPYKGLSKQWHSINNEDLKPEDVAPESNKKVQEFEPFLPGTN